MKKEDQDKLNKIGESFEAVLKEFNGFKQDYSKPEYLTFNEFVIEATSRGYILGSKVECLFDNENTVLCDKFFTGDGSEKTTYWSTAKPANCKIYSDGVWAKIIKDELKLNGHFVNVLNGNMSIGGIVFSVKSFKELTSELENMNINSINHPALGHVEVADMRKVTDTLQPF